MKTLRLPLLSALFGIVLAFLLLADVLLGSVPISGAELWKGLIDPTAHYSDIIWFFRLPKAITCLLAGAALGASGLLMQTLFRNPLAGPDVLGLSSGASLFVALLLLTGQQTMAGYLLTSPWAVALAASLGSALVFVLVMIMAQKLTDNASLLIVGLMIASAVSAVVGVLQYISRADDLQAFIIWSMGTVGGTGWSEIAVLTLTVVVGLFIALLQSKATDTLLLGENYAKSLGVRTGSVRFWLVTATSLMAGGVTAFCGPIAFVGLAVPHLVRLTVSTTRHRTLLPLVMMAGASLLLVCDLIAQLPGGSQMLPLNALTSLFGAPVVIMVILGSKRLRI